MPENIWLNVHLKGDVETAEKATRRLIAHRRLHQAFLACKPEAAAAARRIAPSIKICNMERQANSIEYANRTIAMNADFIQLLGGHSVDPALTKRLREGGVRINYFGTNEADEARKLFEAGVDFPLVDQVGPMLKVADELGIKRLQPVYRPPFRAAPGLFDAKNMKTLGLKTIEGRARTSVSSDGRRSQVLPSPESGGLRRPVVLHVVQRIDARGRARSTDRLQ